jgi:hypothetical protein
MTRSFDEIRAEILGLLDELIEVAESRELPEVCHRLVSARERLLAGHLTAVVCGEFSQGKSTLLNALLEERPPLFPVGTMATTSLVTTVLFGPREHITVTLEDGAGETEHHEITRAEIADWATESGNPDNAKKALLIQAETPNPRLASGLALVDTPGVGGVYTEHTAVTAGFLPNANALIFVTDVLKPLTESELIFLRSAAATARLTDDADAQIFVLTKIDGIGAEDLAAMIANTTRKLAEVTERPAGSLTIVPVSSDRKLAYLDAGDAEDLELSNFESLELVLWAALGRRRVKVLLGDALTVLAGGTQALMSPVEAELRSFSSTTEQQLQALDDEMATRQQRLDELAHEQAGWRHELNLGIREVGSNLRMQAGEGLDRVWTTFSTRYLQSQRFLDHPERLVGQLSADASAVAGAVNELAAREAAHLLRDLARKTGLDLGARLPGRLPDPPVPLLHITGNVDAQDRPDPGMRKLRDSSFSGGLGAAVGVGAGAGIGAVVGTVLLPGVGTVAGAQLGSWIGSGLGALVGATAGYRNSAREIAKQERAARRSSLQIEFAPLRKTQERHFSESISTLMDGLSVAIAAELNSRIAQAKDSLTEAVRRLAAARGAKAEDRQALAAALQADYGYLGRVGERIDELAEEAGALGSAGNGVPGSPPPGDGARQAEPPVDDPDDGQWADE